MKRLNVGSGEFPLPYWINLDADPNLPADIHATVPPLPFDDESLDEIWACHFLEHLSYEGGQAFLAECYRALRPGGGLGIVVPDMGEVLRRWLAGARDAVEWPRGTWWNVADLDAVNALFVYSTVQDTPHLWAYDQGTLARAMRRVGFRDLVEIDRFRDPRIAQGAWYQCGLQGRKGGETNAES